MKRISPLVHGQERGTLFENDKWVKKLNYYDSLGISEILVSALPDVLRKIIPLAKKKHQGPWMDVDIKSSWGYYS